MLTPIILATLTGFTSMVPLQDKFVEDNMQKIKETMLIVRNVIPYWVKECEITWPVGWDNKRIVAIGYKCANENMVHEGKLVIDIPTRSFFKKRDRVILNINK